jgi:phenylalanyl-tRNA synthetase beta chain
MRISLNWLSEYISVPFTPEELSDRLTMLGLEIEAIERVGAAWDKVIVGEVLEVMPHPNADKLRLTKVSIGNGEPLSIVCGAPNVRQGLRVAVAIIGADLGGGMVIKKAKIRGEVSEGMICSERELGISQNHEGIWELPNDAAIGLSLADALGMRDTIFEVGITPNRADCLSHIGIAREIRAITGERIRFPKPSISEKGGEIAKHVRVSLPQPELCPRYVAKLVRGVTIAPSPNWLKRRLEAVGLRPINNVVDVTNFVLMECGHPLHAFDFDVVENGFIEVRTAGGFADEFVTLDGKKRKMQSNALLITDGKKPLGIAGIMGGENSEIRDTTKDVLIESAYFNPTSIRRSAKQLGLSSDASYRFERGADFNILEYAAERAAKMIVELAGGEIVEGVLDECAILLKNKQLRFRPARANTLLGMSVSTKRMLEIFSLLDIQVQNSESPEWLLTAPSYRIDLEREEDAIEEIARIVGYDEVPTSTFEHAPLTGIRDPLKLRDFDSLVRTTLLSIGANECVSIPLVSAKNAAQFHDRPVELINPLNTERDRMRTSVAINLLESARVSERFGAEGQRIFEIGNVFHYSVKPEQLGYVNQSPELGILISGTQEPKTAYNAEAIPSDIFLMKGIAESLLSRIGIREFEYSAEKSLQEEKPSNFLDPSQSITVSSGMRQIGLIGRIAPALVKTYDLRSDVWIALFDYSALYEIKRKLVENPAPVRPLPKYPSVERDIAIMLAEAISARQVEETIRASAKQEILRSIRLFDHFQSKEMKLASERSIAFHLVFRSDDRTLEEHEVDELIILIIKRLEGELHARLRV